MKARGLTLIELTIALAIVVLLFAAVVTSVGAITGSRAKAAAAELGGVIRSLYDTASLTGKTCRLVFQLPDPRDDQTRVKYWAECAAGNVTTRRDRENAIRDEIKKEQEDARNAPRRPAPRSSSAEPTLQEVMSAERDRVEAAAKYSVYTAPEITPRELPSGVQASVWTRHQRDAIGAGTAYLYFFPQGMTERALVYLRQGRNIWTLEVSPLTGKTTVVSDQVEVPRS